MKLSNLLTIISFIFLNLSSVFSQNNYLFVEDPQRWSRESGTIEEAQITIHPKGVYFEVGLYLTLSARNTRFANTRAPLEITMGFDLPKNAQVIDSWLWINDDIIQADIRDRSSATAIYEDIVDRQRDPSLLTKDSENYYQLRVYPLDPDSTRRVKITYLVPGNWTTDQVAIPLPIDLINTTAQPVKELQIQVYNDLGFQTPNIVELSDEIFEEVTHAVLGKHTLLKLPRESYSTTNLHLAMKAPMQNGVYINQYEGAEQNFYQLVILPTTTFAFQTDNAKKVAVLIDYDLSNTDLSKKDILEAVRRQLLDQLADNDFFNIFISETDITPLHETWLPADEATINAFFAAIDSDDLSSFSNLPNLLEKGIAYIQAQGNDGELLLVSNASQIEEIESANTFIAEIRADLINNEIPIHVSDYQDRGGYHYSVNGVSYFGNEYFYNRLTRLTSGELSTIRENEYNLTTTITTSFARIFDLEGILDLHTTLEDGFCYARYDLPDPIGSKSISRPLVQIGKYNGTFPFLIEASGETKGQLFGEKLVIPAEQIQQAPPMSQTIWAGNYIQELEREPTTNSIIREIIDWSINHRVLSYFTAFLALEVEQGGEVCENCIDETDLSTATSEVLADSLVQITASPNPFSEQTTITVQLGNQMDVNSTNFSIYDTNGRAIRTFTSTTNSENRYQFNWDGTDTNGQPLSKGMYLFNVRTEQGMKNLKLIYLK